MASFGFGFKIIIVLQKSTQILFTDRMLPTTGAGIRLEGEKVSPHSLKCISGYKFISSLSRFHSSLTGLVVHAREECRAMAEMTLKIVRCEAVVFDDTEFASRSSVE